MKRLLTCLALLLIATPCSANIVSIGVTGPGGSGHGEASFTNPQEGLLLADFTSLNYLTVSVTVDSASQYAIEAFDSPFWAIGNGTHTTWTSFLLQGGTDLNGASTAQQLQTGTVSTHGPMESIWFHGGQPVNAGQDFNLGWLFTAPTAGTYLFEMIPNAPEPSSDPISTPEPSTFAMMAIGLVVLTLWRLRCVTS